MGGAAVFDLKATGMDVTGVGGFEGANLGQKVPTGIPRSRYRWHRSAPKAVLLTTLATKLDAACPSPRGFALADPRKAMP